jgi:hypothetical protein
MDEASDPGRSRCSRQDSRGFGLDCAGGGTDRPMRAGGEMDDDIDAGEMGSPIGLRADFANALQSDAGDWLGRRPSQAADPMTLSR